MRSRASDHRPRGRRVRAWYRAQPSGTSYRSGPWRSRSGPAGCQTKVRARKVRSGAREKDDLDFCIAINESAYSSFRIVHDNLF